MPRSTVCLPLLVSAFVALATLPATASNLVPLAATRIAAGTHHTCALTSSGGVKCWGSDFDGQHDNPTAVDVPGLSSGVTAISAGNRHACAITAGGGVKCWDAGDNMPVDVPGLSSGVTAIGAGNFHTCALTTGGGVKCWGQNADGQLGNNSTTESLAPVNVSGLENGVTAIAAGQMHNCALTSGGGVKCWGQNTGWQLGDDTSVPYRSTPVDVVGLTNGVAAIAAGLYHSCAVTTGGGAKCWGSNFNGAIGDNSTATRRTPVDVVGLASGVASITAGQYHTCALMLAGGAKCWGRNGEGELGDGSFTERHSPVDVTGLSGNVANIDAGGLHTCAIAAGQAMCWGYNGATQLGDGTSTMRNSPGPVLATQASIAPRSGFNGDVRSDVLWRNSATGEVYQWQMNGLALSGQGHMPGVPTNWAVAGIGDLDADGNDDILWRDASGHNYVWIVDGLGVTAQGYLPSVPAPWIVAGMRDVNGDGSADVLWRNPSTGQNYLWIMNGLSIVAQGYLPSVTGSDWEIVGVADYSGDGKADALWRNKATGQNYLWIMDGLAVTSQGYLPGISDTNWEVAGSPDANGDGKADVLWRHKRNGSNYLWVMNGHSVASQGYMPSVADASWTVAGFGDYNGDGRGDVLWRHATTGQNYLWIVNGLSVTSQGYLPSVSGANWVPAK